MMEDSEELDIDSLVNLLDDDFENESSTNGLIENVKSQEAELTNPADIKKSKSLKESFSESLNPEKVESSRKDAIPADEYPSYKKNSFVHSKEMKEDSDEEGEGLSKYGKTVQKLVTQKNEGFTTSGRKPHTLESTWKNTTKPLSVPGKSKADNSCFTDSFSGIRIINPLVPFDVLKERMGGRRMIKMSFIHNFIRGGDIEGDWVTMGVLVHKLPPKETKTGQVFSIWKMTDLHDPDKIVSVFLFRAAHTDHWKTIIGTVIGILNPKLLPDKDKNGSLSLSVDHPGKFMMLGKSKDFGHCKSRKKDGSACSAVVNLNQCEYCIYHVKHEYQKFSGGRSELQSAYSGREPSLKSKLLKKQNVFYGGQMYTPSEKKATKEARGRDKLTLSSLSLKRKADVLEREEREKGVKKLTELYGPSIQKAAQTNSDFINSQLALPSVGSRNLLHHLMKEKTSKEKTPVKMITPKELLRMKELSFKGLQRNDVHTLQDLSPKLGKGFRPGQHISFDFSSKPSPVYNAKEIAKLKAIKKIQDQGPIKAKDPNSVKVSEDSADKVKAVLEKSFEDKKSKTEEETAESSRTTSKLGTIDLNSERVKEILNKKSSHAYEVEMAEMEKEASYFNNLEKKEQMEEKMLSTKEVVSDVVSCIKCRYTAHSAAQRCIKESHPLKCHKAIKRFFCCKDCCKRTVAYKKYPTQACRNCKGYNFERTAMRKERQGPKTDSEILCIRGEESKFLNSLKPEKLFLSS